MNLIESAIDRQNVLNNPVAVEHIQKFLRIRGMLYEEEFRFTTAQVADFYETNIRTIRRYVENSENELKHNGYCILKGQKLRDFKDLFGYLIYSDLEEDFKGDIDVTREHQFTEKQRLNKIKSLGIFNFRSFLNIGMLLVDSEKANISGVSF